MRIWLPRANLIAQIAIVVTGGLVRLTGSGLGCPNWPNCQNGQLAPTGPGTWHRYVEFGNRTLTGVLLAIAAGTVLTLWSQRDLRKLALVIPGGILLQAVVGGLTVITGLHPLFVSAHLLISMGLIAAAYVLVARNENAAHSPSPLRFASSVQVALAALVLLLGTIVTGTGPHAGDPGEIQRLPFDPRTVSWLHADLVMLFIGLSIGLAIAARAMKLPITRAADGVLHASVLQAVIGYAQYFTGLPWWMVALHLLGSCLVWLSVVRVRWATH